MPFRWTTAALMLAVLTSLPLAAVAKEEEKGPVVARVNGEDIHRSSLERARTLLPEQYRQIPMEMIFKVLVDSLVDMELAAADARDQGLHRSDVFKKQMARIEKQVLQRMALSQEMEAKVTDEAVRKRYESFVEAAASNEEIQARHILLKTEEEAKAVIVDLDKGGDFAQLARDKSTGPSGPGGGDLGFFGRGQMVPEFEEAAFNLETGKHSGAPVKTQFGWHVIKVEERRKAEPPPFEQAEEQLRAELQQTVGAAYVERLRKDAKIERFNLDGSPQEEASEKKPE